MLPIKVNPDIHGRKFWKKTPWDGLEIFLGDYIDPYPPITREDALDNFLEILEYKKQNPGRVILLLGNHDCHYLFDGFVRSSRFWRNPEIPKLYKDSKDLFQFAYQLDNYLFTHAGVSNRWLQETGLELPKDGNYEGWLNSLDIKYYNRIGFERWGDDLSGGPVWADLREHFEGVAIPGITQIIGHTLNPAHLVMTENVCCLDNGETSFLLDRSGELSEI